MLILGKTQESQCKQSLSQCHCVDRRKSLNMADRGLYGAVKVGVCAHMMIYFSKQLVLDFRCVLKRR